ncbi:hypothetical protein IFM47457_06975 [Aspergillus lentulus]|nr:hypothetical protein IFM47457_06975 [Aspergillus lentulus]
MALDHACYIPPGDGNLRSVADIVLKSLSIHIFPLALFGHYMSLSGVPHTALAAFLMIVFACSPISVAALFIWRALRIFTRERIRQQPGMSWSYRLSACVGMWATFDNPPSLPDDDRLVGSVPLIFVDPRDLQKRSLPRNIWWFGRIFMLAIGWFQALMTSILYFRRVSKTACAHLDIINGTLACGSFVVQSFSLFITRKNIKWEVDPRARSLRHRTYDTGTSYSGPVSWPARNQREDERGVMRATSSEQGRHILRQRRVLRSSPVAETVHERRILDTTGLLGWGNPNQNALEYSVETDLLNELMIALGISTPFSPGFWTFLTGAVGCVISKPEPCPGLLVYTVFALLLIIPPIIHLVCYLFLEFMRRKSALLSLKKSAQNWIELGYGTWWLWFVVLILLPASYSALLAYKEYGRARSPVGLDWGLISEPSLPPCNRTFWKDPLAEILFVF